MSLEKFRRSRLVVLGRNATVYQAARAMADNHIGAVLVSHPPGLAGIVTDRDLALVMLGGELEPRTTALDAVMSQGIVTCDIGADLHEVARLMRDHAVRRIPIVEGDRPVGLVTLDDLVVEGTLDPELLRSIVVAQLEVETPQKPAGTLHPKAPSSALGRSRALMRAKQRAEATYGRMLDAVTEATGLGRANAEKALLTASCLLCRRLSPGEAQDLIAQLPSMLQPHLDRCADGPDREVTAGLVTDEIARTLDLGMDEAGRILRAVFGVIASAVSGGQMEEAIGQLPDDMKVLFPATT